MLRPENRGLEQVVAQMKRWYAEWEAYGVGLADMIQFAAQLAVVVCPLGPRSRTFVGRLDSSTAAPDGLLPPADGEAAFLIDLFRNKTIAPHGLTALVGAHTTSQQFFVDPGRAGDPQDSSPGVWDVLFYSQVLDPRATPPRVFRFESDINLSRAPETTGEWLNFANNGQDDWNEVSPIELQGTSTLPRRLCKLTNGKDYAREYIRLSLLSVYVINNMTECTKVLPQRIASFTEPDRELVDDWVKTDARLPAVAETVFNGSKVTMLDFQNTPHLKI